MITLGNHSYCYGVQRGTGNNVIVGNYSCIAENVLFDGGFNHDISFISTFPFSSIWAELPSNIKINGDIHIGHDCWIGEGAIIMSGISIGHGSIIGARTIVTKNVEQYSVVVGAPMKAIRKRYTDEQIQQLLKIEWWKWEDSKVRENVEMLMSDNIDNFLTLHKI